MRYLTLDNILKVSFVLLIVAGLYSAPYWIEKEKRDMKKCKDAGLIYYKPYKSDAICVAEIF